jgi:uncharacterized protein (TIGR02452 family)
MNNRSRRAEIARETVEILNQGKYLHPIAGEVDLSQAQRAAEEGSRLYRPEALARLLPDVRSRPSPRLETRLEVTGESSLAASRRLAGDNGEVLCLNFASAKNPGGGFLGGSQAQEESLARATGLYPCLLRCGELYDYNRARKTGFYSDHMIYSPRVPVLRDEGDALLAAPWFASFVTAPAVNAGILRGGGELAAQIGAAMRRRASYVLAVALEEGHRALVLGAWGCGVFRNDPSQIAEIFASLLTRGGEFAGRFEAVTFAVLDGTRDQGVLRRFERALGAQA